jgi:RNA-directed DNA polymerase
MIQHIEDSRLIPVATELFDQCISAANIRNAWKKVSENGGSAGVDGMTISELQKDFGALWRPVEESLRAETWQPSQLKRVAVPKLIGGTRILKIPNVLDRVVLQAVTQVLQPLWEPCFSNHSYAYRPQRSAHDAVVTAQNLIGTGEGWVVDLDIESFFDRVDCARLITRLEEKRCGEKLHRLVCRCISGAAEKTATRNDAEQGLTGIPQGSPLSPLLANIMLDQLDSFLERQNIRFVRYADDVILFTESRESGEVALGVAAAFLKEELALDLNREKSVVVPPEQANFLGFSFKKGSDGRIRRGISSASKDQFKQRIGELTEYRADLCFDDVAHGVARFVEGWRNYYGFSQNPNNIAGLLGYARTRLRGFIWLSWRDSETRFREMTGHGVADELARRWSRRDVSTQEASASPAMGTAFPNSFFDQFGLGEGTHDARRDARSLPPPGATVASAAVTSLASHASAPKQSLPIQPTVRTQSTFSQPPSSPPGLFQFAVNFQLGRIVLVKWRINVGRASDLYPHPDARRTD